MTSHNGGNLVGDLAKSAARRWSSRPAIVFADERISFDELDARVDLAARGMIALGVARGDRVGLWMMNRPEYVVLALAIARIGAVFVPLNTRYRVDDVSYVIRQSGISTLLTLDRSGPVDFLEMLRTACRLDGLSSTELSLTDFPELKRIVVIGNETIPAVLSWSDLHSAAAKITAAQLESRAAEVKSDDLLMIVYTSGTTGDPKGVMHSHVCVRNIAERAVRFGISDGDRILNYLPMFHLYSWSEAALMSLVTGAMHVILDHFNAATALDAIEAEGISVIHGFDTHYSDLLNEQRAKPRHVASLRLATYPGGAPNSAAIARRLNSEICATVSGFGMTEIWAFASCNSTDDTLEQRCDGSGKPMQGLRFRILDGATGEDAGTGMPGEILVSGYMVTKGYYGKPEETAEAIDAEGWLHTGDMGLMRPDGHLLFIGRHKDILKVGGENVSPAEVELHLAATLDLLQVAVVGVADERLGEVPVAFVVPVADKLTVEHVKASCAGRIASFKIPRHIFNMSELPITPTGKVQKHLLRQEAQRLLRPAAPARREASTTN